MFLSECARESPAPVERMQPHDGFVQDCKGLKYRENCQSVFELADGSATRAGQGVQAGAEPAIRSKCILSSNLESRVVKIVHRGRVFEGSHAAVLQGPGRSRSFSQVGRSTKSKKRRNRWLELIATYKLLQSALLIAVAVGALRLVHKDVADVLSNLATAMRMNTDGRVVSFLLEKASLLNDHRLRQISFFLFFYAGLGFLEGLGLMLEKVWAEYLTAILTASFLPLEIFELTHRVTPIRIALLLINLGVLAYLVFHLIRRKTTARAH